jgi:hypothetical protein
MSFIGGTGDDGYAMGKCSLFRFIRIQSQQTYLQAYAPLYPGS